MGKPIVYRVQDRDGRGPWKPGVSGQWVDDDAPPGRLVETVFELASIIEIRSYAARGYHLGSACRSLDALREWFTPVERGRLVALGFYPVQMTVDVIIGESDWQLLIGRLRPLAIGATRRSW